MAFLFRWLVRLVILLPVKAVLYFFASPIPHYTYVVVMVGWFLLSDGVLPPAFLVWSVGGFFVVITTHILARWGVEKWIVLTPPKPKLKKPKPVKEKRRKPAQAAPFQPPSLPADMKPLSVAVVSPGLGDQNTPVKRLIKRLPAPAKALLARSAAKAREDA